MYGVVLWSDHGSDRTLIWCEDHGNLAFSKSDDKTGVGLHSGDLVRFDMREEGELRIARNISLIASDEYPTLADALLGGDRDCQTPGAPKAKEDKIVAFAPKRATRKRSLTRQAGQNRV